MKRLLRYVKGTEDMSTVFDMRDSNDRREQLIKRLEDSDWTRDQVTRKSTSGAVSMAEGMRLHSHSRCQASVSLSSCEAEVMAASEGIKEALLLQEVLMFVGFWDTMKLKSKWTAARHMHSSIHEVLDA